MPPITKQIARDLARAFHELSHTLGEYRFARWDDLSAEERRSIEDLEWSLQNMSSDMITVAVGAVLDDLDGPVKAVQAAADAAKEAIADVHAVGKVLVFATKALALGGAFVSHDPSAIANAAGGLVEAIKDVTAHGGHQ